MRIPTNLISGGLTGAAQGYSRGGDEKYETSPAKTAITQVVLNTLQGQMIAGASGFSVGGLPGMVTSMFLDAMGAGAGVYMFVKGGSAKKN